MSDSLAAEERTTRSTRNYARSTPTSLARLTGFRRTSSATVLKIPKNTKARGVSNLVFWLVNGTLTASNRRNVKFERSTIPSGRGLRSPHCSTVLAISTWRISGGVQSLTGHHLALSTSEMGESLRFLSVFGDRLAHSENSLFGNGVEVDSFSGRTNRREYPLDAQNGLLISSSAYVLLVIVAIYYSSSPSISKSAPRSNITNERIFHQPARNLQIDVRSYLGLSRVGPIACTLPSRSRVASGCLRCFVGYSSA